MKLIFTQTIPNQYHSIYFSLICTENKNGMRADKSLSKEDMNACCTLERFEMSWGIS